MAKMSTMSKEQTKGETTITDDYRQRLSKFLEEEGEQIRKKADQELASMIAKAREEYRKRIACFLEEEGQRIRRQAEHDGASIISQARGEMAMRLSRR